MWDNLHHIYEQKSQTAVHILQQRWFQVSKDPTDDMATHIAKVEDLACKLRTLGEPVSDSAIIVKILMTLPTSYSHFITAWESSSAGEKTLGNLVERLLIEETRLKGKEQMESEALAAMRRQGKSGIGKKNFSKGKQERNPGICYGCNKGNHWKRDCPELKKKCEEDKKQSKGEALMSVLTTITDAYCGMEEQWYVDSGATDHMTGNKGWFDEYKTLNEPKPIKLGNGQYIYAKGIGTVNVKAFNGHEWKPKYLSNVLYVPNIKYNLSWLSYG